MAYEESEDELVDEEGLPDPEDDDDEDVDDDDENDMFGGEEELEGNRDRDWM